MRFIRPKRIPEANVQAEIYRLLRNKGIKCCLEYRVEVPEYNNHLRADIAIINGDDIACLVEVKSRKNGKINKEGRQYKKYISLGVPVIYCLSFKEVGHCVDEISKLIGWR